jgi:hypothetical protein
MSAVAQLETELAGFYAAPPQPAIADTPSYALTGAADARRRIDAIIERVRRGESG